MLNMRYLIGLLFLVLFQFVYGQDNNISKRHYLIDSLRNEFLNDTTKFLKSDLVVTERGLKNINEYSKLIVIDGTYIFRPELLETKILEKLITEIFVDSKIEDIVLFEKEKASILFDGPARNGMVLIRLKKNTTLPSDILDLSSNDNYPLKDVSDINPKFESFLVVAKDTIPFDKNININPKWIKQIKVVKEEQYKYIYGNSNGKVYIYPKKKYMKKLSVYSKQN